MTAAESKLRARFEEQISDTILYFLCDDYDYNGTEEAFVVTGPEYINLYYVDEESLVNITNGHVLFGYEFQDPDKVREEYFVDTGLQKFYIWENYAGGSGSTSYVFGVRDGQPYEPTISGNVQGFCKEEDRYVYYRNDFSEEGHKYILTELYYDPETGEFEE